MQVFEVNRELSVVDVNPIPLDTQMKTTLQHACAIRMGCSERFSFITNAL